MFNKDRDQNLFYSFEPPWIPYENMNVFGRLFELNRQLENIREGMENLDKIKTQIDTHEVVTEAGHIIGEILEGVEVFLYNFTDLLNEEWFHAFWQELAGAYWRIEKGKFSDKPCSP